MKDVLGRHEKIVLQFSGGKDSLACLFLLREFWDQICVVWVNTGDAFPETLEVIDKVVKLVPNFIELRGKRAEMVEAYGQPFDIVPVESSEFGHFAGDKGLAMQNRYDCCARVQVKPMEWFVQANGFTLIIRGQKTKDTHKSPVISGSVIEGLEYLFPIEGWSDEEVLSYLESQPIAPPRFYESMTSCPDCMHCTAWLQEGRLEYLRKYYPETLAEVEPQILRLVEEVSTRLADASNVLRIL